MKYKDLKNLAINANDSKDIVGSFYPMLSMFKNLHKGDHCFVCGLGTSLNLLDESNLDVYRYWTISMNDICRKFHPTYHVMVDSHTPEKISRRRDKNDFMVRYEYIQKTKAMYYFMPISHSYDFPPDRTVRIRYRSISRVENIKFGDIPYLFYRTTMTVAIHLALYMGFSKLGILGLDFTPDYFYAKTGAHEIIQKNKGDIIGQLNKVFSELNNMAICNNQEIINLNPNSLIKSFKFGEISEINMRNSLIIPSKK